ncbi:MAG: PAS domain S-box protein [Candidatus Thorarchaeota archaeon]|jgi:PAS domain S-box-containing protein
MMAELPWTSTIQVNHLFELLKEGLVVLDNSGAIIHSNQAFADFLQYAAGDLVDRRFEDLVVEGQRGALVSHLSDKRGQPLSLSLVTRDGEAKALDVRTLGLVEEDLPKGVCLVITESSETEMLFKRIVDGAFLKMMTVDPKLNITYVNQAFGESAEEIIGQSALEGVAPEFRSSLKDKLETTLNTGQYQELEISESLPGKPLTWHGLRIGPIKLDDSIIGAVIAAYDITDKLAALQALKEGEEKFRSVFEHANDGITLVDEEGKIIEINASQENIFGIKREGVIGMPIWELQASMLAEGEKIPEHEKYLESSVSSFFETRTAPWLERKTKGEFIHPLDGSRRYFEQTAFSIPTSKGFKLCSFVRDITEETEREEALKLIENRHEQALMGADLGVWEWIRDSKTGAETWHVNQRFADIMGYTIDEIKSHFLDWSSIIHPEDYPMVHNHWEKHEAKELSHYSVEYRLKTKDGDWKWILDRGMIVEWDENGSALKSSGTFLDITDRKVTQSALDEIRERYELALRGAELGVWDWNSESDEMVFSERWGDILGYGVNEFEPSLAGWESLIHPDDVDMTVSRWNAHVVGEMDFYSSEHRMRTKNGEWKWVLERGRVVEWNEEGGTKRATGTMLDITESKNIEKALRQSEEKYRNLLENIPQRVFYKDRDSVYIAANPSFAAELGIVPSDIVGKTDFDLYPTELADYFVATDREVLESLKPFESDESHVLDEETRYSQIMKAPVRDDEGNVVGILGIFWDTTDKTLAAEALRESETKYRSLVEQSVMGLAILPQGLDNIVFANPKIGDILGFTPEELIAFNNEQIRLLIHPDDVDSLVKYLNSFLQTTKTGESIQVRMIHNDGSEIWTAVSAGGIEFENNPAVQISVIDITKRQHAQSALETERRTFQSIASAAVGLSTTSELSNQILKDLIDILGFDFGTLRLYDEAKQILSPTAIIGIDSSKLTAHMPCSFDDPPEHLVSVVAISQEKVIASNIRDHETTLMFKERLDNLGVKSIVVWPIIKETSGILGVLTIGSYNPKEISKGTQPFFDAIAGMLTTILERMKTEQALKMSERRYRELLTDMSEGIGIADFDERVLFVNDAFANILGYPAEELLGMSILDLVAPEDMKEILKQTDLRREGNTSAYTHRFIRKDGEYRTVRVSGVPSRNDSGEIDGTIAIVTDITERVKAEEALKESELKFRRVFESMPVSMYLLRLDEDEEFTLVDANPASDRLFKLEHAKYLGKKVSEIRLPHRSNEIPIRLKEVLTTGVSWNFDETIYDGDDIRMAMEVQVFRTSTDTVVNSFLDITERVIKDLEIKRLNEGLSRIVGERTAELAAANKELEAFAYSVSHDLRAPLRTIDGFSQALLEDYLDSIDDTGKDFLQRVRAAATHMGALIEDLLVLSRVTRAEMDRTDVDLSILANDILKEFREVEPDRKVEVKISDYLPVRCDRRLIKLVLQNLMDNAWKFTNRTEDANIEFGSIEKDGEIQFFVKDNGAGFDMDYSDKLFLPFQRLHTAEEFEGSGIGLATVQRVINRHGGRVWAESNVNIGSTFYFTIPD